MGSNPAANGKMPALDENAMIPNGGSSQNNTMSTQPQPQQQSQQQQQQPMYRKRENKPGQKEKQRVVRKNAPSPSPHRKQGRDSKDNKNVSETEKAHSLSSSTKTNQNAGNPKKKTKKQEKVKGKNKNKKKSKLSFWFCVSANTEDNSDRKSQVPITKPKSSIETNRDNNTNIVQDAITMTTNESTPPVLATTTKRSRRNATKRFSAPASSDWASVVTKATVESPSQVPRARTPTRGVRYRYDGTLERPYVYPGGLTFQSGDRSRDDYRTINSSMCDTTFDDAFDQTNGSDHFNQFYLRYDSDLSSGSHSHPRDRRNSMPMPGGNPGDIPGGNLVSGDSERPVCGKPDGMVVHLSTTNDDKETEDYDIPYESGDDNDNEKNDVGGEREEPINSYYSRPLQSGGCIYMWHSCEDLQHCEDKYHSKNRIHCFNENMINDECSTTALKHHVSNDSPTNAFTKRLKYSTEKSRPLSLPIGLHCDSIDIKSTDSRTAVSVENNSSGNDSSNGSLVKRRQQELTSPASLPDQAKKQHDSPFMRNVARSSGMPGNKRFFIPPPPCYTPPREEMEAALSLINNRCCQRGSQTDLPDDVDTLDMEVRDGSLQRQTLPSPPQHNNIGTSPSQSQNNNIGTSPSQSQDNNIDTSNSRRLGLCSEAEVKQEGDKNTQPEAGTTQSCELTSNHNNMQKNTQNSPSVTHTHTHTHTSNSGRATKSIQSVITSTPKPNRKSDQQAGDEPITVKPPTPVPRKRNLNRESMSSSFSIPEMDIITLQPIETDPIDQSKNSTSIVTNNSTSIVTNNSTSIVTNNSTSIVTKNSPATSTIRPVPKKRRSQMIDADTYTHVDIVKALGDSDTGTHSVLSTVSDKQQPSADNKIHNNELNSNSKGRSRRADSETPPTGVTGVNVIYFNNLQDRSTKSDRLQKDTASTAAPSSTSHHHRRQTMTSSPVPRTSRLNSSLDCPVEGNSGGVGYTLQKTAATCSSMDAMVDVFQRMPYHHDNNDDDDNCNADDEMSINNEDWNGFYAASVQNWLRSHSIFDRSLAVTRKRRQRLRDRKCRSQLLSSAELDDFQDVYERDIWNSRLRNPTNTNTKVIMAGSNEEEPVKPFANSPWLLLKHNRLWQHSFTDSGNDSDMMSPPGTRDLQHLEDVFEERDNADPGLYASGSAPAHDRPWEAKLRRKHQLIKARSIEQLYLTLHTSAGVVHNSSLETPV